LAGPDAEDIPTLVSAEYDIVEIAGLFAGKPEPLVCGVG
jgi:hypothetical protein